jgi:mRNA interferase MazF
MVKTSKQAPKQGEIIWIDFDPQSGHEQAGRRPALVLSHTTYNQKIGRAFICPITSKVKGYPFEIRVKTATIDGVVLADHFKNLDWTARNTTTTGERVSQSELEAVWAIVQSIVALP